VRGSKSVKKRTSCSAVLLSLAPARLGAPAGHEAIVATKRNRRIVSNCDGGEETRSGPVSRVLSRAVISLGRRLPAASSNRPGGDDGSSRSVPATEAAVSPLLGLAPGGVCPASPVTRTAVRSYRTISPLPHRRSDEAVCFLWHCPGPCGRWVLPTTVPCGARTFLPGSG